MMASPVYMIGQHNIADFERYRQAYGVPVTQQLTRAGAELIAGDPSPAVLEGTWPWNWTTIIRFPSIEAARAWHASPEYAPLQQARRERFSQGGNLVLVAAFDPALAR